MADPVPPTELPPIALPDVAAATAGVSLKIDVLTNDSDPNPGESAFLIVNLPSATSALGASLQVVDGEVKYGADAASFASLAPGQTVTDTFTYMAEDQWHETSTPVTVTVTVTGATPPPPPPPPMGKIIIGCNQPNLLVGTEGSDWIFGGNNKDTLIGGGGHDTISGDNGKDLIFGGAGNDLLCGGNGDDTLVGDAGNDVLSGGNGANVFSFEPGFGNDRIVDFDPKNDKISMDSMYHSFNEVKAHAAQVGCDVVISYGSDHITLEHTLLSSLRSSDFIFS